MSDILNIIAPVFIIIACGYGAAKSGLIAREGVKGLNDFVLYFCIPPLLFRTMQTVDLSMSATGVWSAYYTAAAIIWFSVLLAARRVKGLGDAGGSATAFASTFGNLGMMGLSIAYLAFGEEGLITAALIIAVHASSHWFFGTLWAELANAERGVNLAKITGGVIVSLAKNPVVLALAAGGFWNASGFAMPLIGERLIDLGGDAAIPAGLFGLGLGVAGYPLRGNLSAVGAIMALKMVLFPLIAWALAALVFHLEPRETALVTLFAALPTGINPYLFAVKFNASVTAVSGAIAIGTIFSALTIPVVLWLVGR
ncbi:AEC family transporter [Hyphococcus sp.]|uniref:AEC family transporter n=1 Tax=Hyphococcus sp. TaxID=2038636 RepID=UPI0020891CAC|nr:MAG: permease [Marinicaulis sp.]